MMTTTPLRQIDANAITNNAPKGRGDEEEVKIFDESKEQPSMTNVIVPSNLAIWHQTIKCDLDKAGFVGPEIRTLSLTTGRPLMKKVKNSWEPHPVYSDGLSRIYMMRKLICVFGGILKGSSPDSPCASNGFRLAPFEAYLDSIIDTLPIFIYTLTLTGSASKVDGVLGPKELLTFYILDLEHPQFSFTCFDPVVDDKSGLRICQSIKFLNWAVSKNNHGALNDIITLLEPMAARKTEGPATVVKPVITLEIVMSFIFALVLWARPPLQAAPTEKLSVIGNLLNNPVILAHFFAPLFTTGTEIDFDLALEITTILTDCGWPHANGLQAQIFAPKRQADETDMEVAKVKQKAAETDKEVAKVKQHMNGLEQKWDKKFGLFVSLIFTIISTGFANMALKMKDMTDVMGDASRAQSRADTESRDPSSTVL